MTTWTLERTSALADRLKSKNCLRLAGIVLLAGLSREREAGREPSGAQWLQLGYLMRQAGDPAGGATVYREAALAAMKAGRYDSILVMLLHGLSDCCAETSQFRAARRIRALHDRIATALDDDADRLLPVDSASVLVPAAYRCTFMLNVDWQSPANPESVEENGFVVLRDRVRLGDADAPWFEFEAKVPCGPEPRFPHVAMRAALPWRLGLADDLRPVLEVVNDLNRCYPTVSTCLEPESGQIVVHGVLGFTGFHVAARDALGRYLSVHEELVINLMLNVFHTASVGCKRVAALAQRLDIDGSAGRQAAAE